MCKHGTYAIMNLEVEIDKCMVPLIKTLQKFGIKTTSCCCGHGEIRDGEKKNNHIVNFVNFIFFFACLFIPT